MSFLDRCKTLRERIEKHESLRRAHKDAEAFRDRATALEEIHRELESTMRRVEVLRVKGFQVMRLPDPTAAVALGDEYARELANGSTEVGKEYGRFKRSVEKVTRDVVAVVAKALEAVKRDLPTIEEAFLKQVELIPAYAEQVARIRRERDVLFARAEPAGMSSDDLATFLDRRDDLRKLADQLSPTEFPKDVLDFFRAARQQDGAPLEKFTETVRVWLHERDQLKNVRVRVIPR
jgi:hypothetical protein